MESGTVDLTASFLQLPHGMYVMLRDTEVIKVLLVIAAIAITGLWRLLD
jgi:hypothetical protein